MRQRTSMLGWTCGSIMGGRRSCAGSVQVAVQAEAPQRVGEAERQAAQAAGTPGVRWPAHARHQ